MPVFHYFCFQCQKETKKLLAKEVDSLECPFCGAELERDMKGPSARVVEKLDNGVMRRSVERLADAERLYKDRAAKHRESLKENVKV